MEKSGALCWLHFGDLHIQNREDENYLDFLELIQAANCHLDEGVDFAFLPGDNADEGSESQYQLVREALTKLKLPVHIITGDHDRKGGTLEPFQSLLEPNLYRAHTTRNFRLLFLNAMDDSDPKVFDLSSEQFAWVEAELRAAVRDYLRPLLFLHLYPSELRTKGRALSRLIAECGVETVDMGHTHYNELANDGRTIYSATRSTGQIEEGPPGFSITVIDGDVVSWKFKQRGTWPFVIITSPADRRLITQPETEVVHGTTKIRAKVWPTHEIRSVVCLVNGALPKTMTRGGPMTFGRSPGTGLK